MDAAKFRAALDRLGLTQLAFGRLVGVAERTVRRWATGDQPVPRSIALVLALMERFALTPEDLDKLV